MIVLFKKTLRLYVVIRDKVEFSFKMPRFFQQGVGSPDLGIGATRNSVIINQLLGRNAYRIPKQSSFQHYGLPE